MRRAARRLVLGLHLLRFGDLREGDGGGTLLKIRGAQGNDPPTVEGDIEAILVSVIGLHRTRLAVEIFTTCTGHRDTLASSELGRLCLGKKGRKKGKEKREGKKRRGSDRTNNTHTHTHVLTNHGSQSYPSICAPDGAFILKRSFFVQPFMLVPITSLLY